MISESLLENLSIYRDNLSVYYVGSVFITFLSVVLTWWYHRYNINKIQAGDENQSSRSQCKDIPPPESDEVRDAEIVTQLKLSKQSLLAEQVAATLTEDQLKEEREMEQQQLQVIFQLLQSQEDKFQVSSLEELHDQMKLYRH